MSKGTTSFLFIPFLNKVLERAKKKKLSNEILFNEARIANATATGERF